MKGAMLFCVLFVAVLVSTNANADANQNGFISINNRGGNVSYFVIYYYYTLNGNQNHKDSSDFTLGRSRTIPIPAAPRRAGATDVHVKVMCYWFPGSTVFTRDYPDPVEKCSDIRGTRTTLNPTYEEIKC